ncbi:MAG: hypothetical protein HYZ81_19115 [Nitrospinae bacterium]|nr:hypothetical protein [Nitrospinota bacterium]
MRKKVLPLMVVIVGLAMMGCESMMWMEPLTQQTIRLVPTGQTYVPATGLVRPLATGRMQVTTVTKVAIFPFADYSHQQSFLQPLLWGGNHRITEAIADRFIAHGITVALQEDVDGLLVAEGIMRPGASQYVEMQNALREEYRRRGSEAGTPEFELARGLHDQVMQEEVQKIVRNLDYVREASFQLTQPGEPHLQGVMTVLSREKLIELGRMLDVDLIIRGRILEYGLKAPPSKSSVVQVRMYAQDARTGEVVWSNRGEIEVEPQPAFGRRVEDLKTLLDRATRELANALMADFFGER